MNNDVQRCTIRVSDPSARIGLHSDIGYRAAFCTPVISFELWGKANIKELRKRGLELKNGIPTHHTFSRLFRKMPPRLLKKLMKDWSEPLRELDAGSVVSVYGKRVASRIVKIAHRCHHCASATANDGQY